MLRKRSNRLALGLLLFVALAAPGPAAQAQNPAPSRAASTPASPRAAIWAATTEYVYADDKALVPILPALRNTISNASLATFKEGLDKAVALEKQSLKGQNHLGKFQQIFTKLDNEYSDPNNPQALVEAIINKLDDNQERMADPTRSKQLGDLEQRLNQLAAGTMPGETTAPPAPENQPLPTNAPDADGLTGAPDEPLTEPANTPAAATAPAVAAVAPAAAGGSLLWLALAMSGLSLAGVIYLITGKKPASAIDVPSPTPVARQARPERTTRQSAQENITWDEVKKYVDRQLDERLLATAAAPPAALPPLVTGPMLVAAATPVTEPVAEPAPAPPAPRSRSQYVNEAPFNGTFPARALSDQPGAYSMFVITSPEQQPDYGSFAVTGNLASHVRDHRSVLEPVCEYVGSYPLGSESRIVTVEPGEVRRRGSDWEVTRKARVRFE